MESETELTESNLNTVKELLLDEDKTVTYISLSKELCLHVNISKILLHRVIQNIRKDKRNKFELKVNYLISGLSKSNEARITVCSESELEELRSTFKIVYFEHIYSISKGSNTNSLMINNYNDFGLCSGSIKNRDCVKHSSSEINNFKSSSLIVSDGALSKPVTLIKKVKAESIEKNTNGKNGFHQEKNIISANDTETKVKKEEVSPKKENSTKQNSQRVNGNNKTQKGIVGFFNKSSTHNKTSQNNAEKLSTTEKLKNGSENTKISDIKVEKMEVDQINSKSRSANKSKSKNIDLKCEQPINTDHKENHNSNSNSKNKTLNEIKKSSKVDKKRKRVLHVSDSESEVESDHEKEIDSIPPESDDEIPPTPMANNIKITMGLVNPKKKRKVIDKTYEDDGFILTKKVEVYESCSEEETVLDVVPEIKIKEVKKEISPNNNIKQKKSKKKMSSPQKGKQATLMNFFKKK